MRLAAMGLMCSLILWGADKKVPLRSTENGLVEITATALIDREAIKQALGSDLGGHYIVVEVHLTPRDAAKVAIHLDDFTLRTDKDGERTTPFAPSQIAGNGALVVSTGSTSGGTVMAGAPGPPGLGPYGGLGGGGVMGGGFEGQKMKDLELIYTTPEGKLLLRFGK